MMYNNIGTVPTNPLMRDDPSSQKKRFTLPQDDLLALLDKNPPNLYSSLASALSNTKFKEKVKNVAEMKKELIEEIKVMEVEELNKLLCAAEQYL